MINSFGNLGGFAGPYVIGYLTDHTKEYGVGYGAGIIYIGIMAIAGAALVLSVSAARSAPAERSNT